ncbi:MAG: alpha-glucan family phosphorylase [Chloroflexi bacterium]|nr:alpha-glucan family phosphorylase [Chloroflexota bacterium]
METATGTLTVAYFSMEFAVDPAIPTYSGGLGILAGDTMRAAADLGLPAAGVTLLHRKGYFRQHLDEDGNQSASPVEWSPEKYLQKMPPRVMATICSRQVQVQAWRYLVRGQFGHTVPVYFLDTALPENTPWDQHLTDYLYGGDAHYRLCQEVILGWGGTAMLRMLGYHNTKACHINEGHSALACLALLEEQTWGRGAGNDATPADVEAVRQRCVFTTHTPLPVGHDGFPLDLVRGVLGSKRVDDLMAIQCCSDGALSMTNLALNLSRYVNGVSMRHEEVSRNMFTNHRINAITNGVHVGTWTSAPFCRLYDHCIPEWRRDNLYLRYAINIPLGEIRQAHAEAKQGLLAEVEQRTGVRLDPAVMTIGLARRVTAYKRSDLLFSDLERLTSIARQAGPLQVICGGKAHPADEGGKALIRRIFQAKSALEGIIPVVYLEDYDMALAKYLCSGVDLWLNTPQKPREASGTSGMKAALNGVPSLSILDGWWLEGHIEGVTGWCIGDACYPETRPDRDAPTLYDKLEQVIAPLFYQQQDGFASVMRSAIAMNGSYFNTQRMLGQYLQNAYLRGDTNLAVPAADIAATVSPSR